MTILLRMWTPNKIGAFGSLGSSGSLGSTGSKGFKRSSWSADSTGSTRARNFWFLFPLVLSLSSRQLFKVKTSLFEWKHCHISLKWWSFHPIPLFEWKKVSFDDFFMTTWARENESERKKEPQIPRLCSFWNQCKLFSKAQLLNKFQISGSYCTARSADLFIAPTLVAILQA